MTCPECKGTGFYTGIWSWSERQPCSMCGPGIGAEDPSGIGPETPIESISFPRGGVPVVTLKAEPLTEERLKKAFDAYRQRSPGRSIIRAIGENLQAQAEANAKKPALTPADPKWWEGKVAHEIGTFTECGVECRARLSLPGIPTLLNLSFFEAGTGQWLRTTSVEPQYADADRMASEFRHAVSLLAYFSEEYVADSDNPNRVEFWERLIGEAKANPEEHCNMPTVVVRYSHREYEIDIHDSIRIDIEEQDATPARCLAIYKACTT